MDRSIILIAHNLRSCHNVGSLLRTSEGLGVKEVYLTGYTPYPAIEDDTRLPHLKEKITRQIQKTALGSEKILTIHYSPDVDQVIKRLKNDGYQVIAVEQTPSAIALPKYKPADRIALVVGREVEGLEPEVLELTDQHIEIPMLGKKESLNVVQAAAMALYHCRFAG